MSSTIVASHALKDVSMGAIRYATVKNQVLAAHWEAMVVVILALMLLQAILKRFGH